MGTRHGRTLHVTVIVAGERTEDLRAFRPISSRSADIHPVPVIGIKRPLEICCDGTYAKDGFVLADRIVTISFVA